MKTFYLVAIFSIVGILSSQAQEKTYIPNARQAVQKSRMQQPQYMEVSNRPVSTTVAQSEPTTIQVSTASAPKSNTQNSQAQQSGDIDAPKRRGNKSSNSTLTKLASNLKF